MTRLPIVFPVALFSSAILSACASHPATPTANPVALAAVHADLRVVGGETTWVTRGRGYELVARSRADLATMQPGLDRAAAFLAQIYPSDSLAPIVATVRRAPAPGKPYVTAAPVPTDSRGALVELVIVDRKELEEQRKNRSAQPPTGDVEPRDIDPTAAAVRAWLSARATRLTGSPANLNQSRGETEDPRVPAFATAMIDDAGNDNLIDNSNRALGAHIDALIPLSRYFTMERPSPSDMGAGRRGGSGGTTPTDGRTGGMGGGMGGGRGGMGGGGGRRGGMGGGGGGGRGASGGSAERTFPLEGRALFAAQSAVLSKYFARSGSDLVGELIDARITGKPIDDVFTKHNLGSVQQVDDDWRSWVAERADMLTRR